MDGYRYLKDVATLELLADRCTGCGRCTEVCPHAVFAPEGRRVRVADRDACMECGACMRNCPAGAIRVDAGVGCAHGIVTEWLRDIAGRRTGDGCCP